MRYISGAQDAQLAHGLKPHVFALGGDVIPRATFFIGAVDDLVVDVGDVADEGHLEAAPQQMAADGIEHHQHAGMPHMAEVVHSDAADVHPHLARGQRTQGLLAAGQRVVKLDRHRVTVGSRRGKGSECVVASAIERLRPAAETVPLAPAGARARWPGASGAAVAAVQAPRGLR